jgi:serine/threonine-protein kinase RsbT
VSEPVIVPICSSEHAISARANGRELARRLGFSSSEVTLIVTVISELTRNILQYAQTGEVVLTALQSGDRVGLEIQARDSGPGIPNIQQALQTGYSTSGGLGVGLPGVKRLMDECIIESEEGKGTTVTVRKWRKWQGSRP